MAIFSFNHCLHLKRLCLGIGGFSLLLASEFAHMSAHAEEAVAESAFLPLGVYWPESLGFPHVEGDARWEKIDALLADLQRRHVNTVWLNHGRPEQQAEYARRAAKYDIRLVAAMSIIHTEQARARKNYASRIERALAGWGDAPPPLAWGIGDEPYTQGMPEVADCAALWAERGEPTAIVVMPRDIPTAARLVPLRFLATDVYPFFGETCPNGPNTQAQSQLFILDAMDKLLKATDHHRSMEGWFMGAAFQNVHGPSRLSPEGNYVILPGGQNNFRMPTPAELRWQAWMALAGGARGIVMFALFFYDEPREAPLKGDWGLSEERDTGAPGGLLYPDGRTTPQYDALGEVFARMSRIAAPVRRMTPLNDMAAFHAQGWPPIGDCVRNFVDERDGTRYVVVVNGNLQAPAVVPINIEKRYVSATDLCRGQELAATEAYTNHWVPIGQPFRQLDVDLAAGSGTLLRLNLDREKQLEE